MPSPEIGSKKPGGITRRTLLAYAGAAFVGAGLGVSATFKKRILETAKPPEVLPYPLPYFELRERQDKDPSFRDALRFYPQLLSDEPVINVDTDRFKKEYLASGMTLEARGQVIYGFLLSCIEQLLQDGVDPGLYLNGLPTQRFSETKVGLLNSFLVKQNKLFLDFRTDSAVLNIWNVESLETLVVGTEGKYFGVPVAHLGDSLFTASEVPQKSFDEAARYQPFPGLIVTFPEDDDIKKKTKVYHEGTHALVSQTFKKTHRAMLEMSTVPVSHNVQFGEGVIWKIQGQLYPILFDEMCAEGASQATVANNNRESLFALFTIGEARQYQYCTIYALHALLAIPEFPEEYKAKIRTGLSGGNFEMQYEDLQSMVNHPSLTSQKIQEIYYGMWKTGFQILEEIEGGL